MDWIQDAIIVAGMTSAMLLWVFCLGAALHALWDTFGEHVLALIEKIRK